MKITVIKIGGNAVRQSSDRLVSKVRKMLKAGRRIVVVHGGGPEVNLWLEKIGIKPKFVDGVRYTDGETLDVAVAVLAGKMNKEVVSLFIKNNISAVGLSGVDGKMVLCRRIGKLGFVGEPVKINKSVLSKILESGLIPVISSIGTDIKSGGFLNVNADVMADFLSRSIKAERLIYVTDVAGVLDDKGKVIKKITRQSYEILVKNGTITGGMIPKIRSCLESVKKGVKEVVITNLKSSGTIVGR